MCVHKQIRETEKAIQMVSQIPQQRDSRLSISTPRSWPPTQEPLRTTILNQTPKLMLLLGNTNTHTNQCLLHLLHYQHYLWVYSIYTYIYIIISKYNTYFQNTSELTNRADKASRIKFLPSYHQLEFTVPRVQLLQCQVTWRPCGARRLAIMPECVPSGTTLRAWVLRMIQS